MDRFDDFDATRPSTAPSPSDTLQTRAKPSVLSSMRTGLEPSRSSDIFASGKATNEASASGNWLGLTDDNSDKDDEFLLRTPKKTESVVTSPAKKATATSSSMQDFLPAAVEPPKRSVLDDLLDKDRLALNEKTAIKPAATASTKVQDFWLEQPTPSNNRPSTAGASRTTDFSTSKSATRSSYETKNDFRTYLF